MERSREKRNYRIYVNNLLIIIIAFLVGAVFDSFLGPVIKINYLTEIKTIETKISKRNSIEKNTEYVVAIIDKAYIKAEDFDYMVDAFYNELTYIESNFNSQDYKRYAESEALKGFLNDLERNDLILKYDYLGGYIITPDVNYLKDKYYLLVNEEVKDYLDFRTNELNNHIYNINIGTIDIDEVVKRIENIQNIMKKSNLYYDTYSQLLNYYYRVFEGKTHDFFVEGDTLELTDYAKKEYEKYSGYQGRIGEISKDILLNGTWQKNQN